MLGLEFVENSNLTVFFSFYLLEEICVFRSFQFEIVLKSQLNDFSNVLFRSHIWTVIVDKNVTGSCCTVLCVISTGKL